MEIVLQSVGFILILNYFKDRNLNLKNVNTEKLKLKIENELVEWEDLYNSGEINKDSYDKEKERLQRKEERNGIELNKDQT